MLDFDGGCLGSGCDFVSCELEMTKFVLVACCWDGSLLLVNERNGGRTFCLGVEVRLILRTVFPG